ncbi:MAG: hypothetical protein ATN35_09045 [Epulopiscium sp. Nele67-Bin004]|nr:MAG: hypothetical protein ATN35_09045 [Epulopiscium sp. Nele67-Bin004]
MCNFIDIEFTDLQVKGEGIKWQLLDKAKVQQNIYIFTLTEQILKIEGFQFVEGISVKEYIHYLVLRGKSTAKVYEAEIINPKEIISNVKLDSDIIIDNCGYKVNINLQELKNNFEEGFYEVGILTYIKSHQAFIFTDTEGKLYITPTKVTKVNRQKYLMSLLDRRIKIDIEKIQSYNQLVGEFSGDIELPDKLPTYTEGPPKIIWVCWFQGIENAPPVVKACYNNLMKRYPDYKKILITADNYTDYIEMDSVIVEKWKKGIIDNTKFSNSLRLELLVEYGGVWIDSTILCTTDEMPKYIEESPLFMYRFRHIESDIETTENSLIGSCQGHIILRTQRDILIKYWHKKDDLIHYSMLNMFFKFIIDSGYQSFWEQVPYLSNEQMLMSYQFLPQEYNEKQWNFLMESSPFYKLTYKLGEDTLNSTNTYYAHIIKTYS